MTAVSGPPFPLLLLADGRLPAGGHAHSAGAESAVADGRVHDEATLEAFIRGRLATVGLADAALAAATLIRLGGLGADGDAMALLADLDAEADARIAPPPLRIASRKLGRQLIRVALPCWPTDTLRAAGATWPAGLHLSVAHGVVGAAVGIDPIAVAALVLHHAAATPAQAGLRLLGLDPFAVTTVLAHLAVYQAELAVAAVAVASGPVAALPAGTGPLCDVAAMTHADLDPAMFAT